MPFFFNSQSEIVSLICTLTAAARQECDDNGSKLSLEDRSGFILTDNHTEMLISPRAFLTHPVRGDFFSYKLISCYKPCHNCVTGINGVLDLAIHEGDSICDVCQNNLAPMCRFGYIDMRKLNYV